MSSTGKNKTRPPGARKRRRKGWLTRLRAAVDRTWRKTLELEPMWAALFLVGGTLVMAPWGFESTPELEVGTIASRDYVAPRDLSLPDEEATEKKKERARSDVLPVYDFDPRIADAKRQALERLFEGGRGYFGFGEGAAPPAGGAPRREELKKHFLDTLDAAGVAALPVSELEVLPPAGSAEDAAQSLRTLVSGALELKLRREEFEVLFQAEFSPELEERLVSLVGQVLRTRIANKGLADHHIRGVMIRNLVTGAESHELDIYKYLEYPRDVTSRLTNAMASWPNLPRQRRQTLQGLLERNLPPNVVPNEPETRKRQDAAAAATVPAFNQFRQGQVIVRKGDEINAVSAQIMSALAAGEGDWTRVLPVMGNGLLLALIVLMLWLALKKEKLIRVQARRVFGGILLLLLLSLLAARLGFIVAEALSHFFDVPPFNSIKSYGYAIPFAALALVTSLLYRRNTALLLSIGFSLLVGRLVGEDSVWAVVYCLVGSLAAIYSLDQFKQRTAVNRAALVVGLANMVSATMLFTFTGELPIQLSSLGLDLACAFAGGILVGAVTSFAVPILESLLSVTTDIKLLELSDTNRPLLRQLAFEAPGTFQHSIMVANLAKAGCEAIGANSVLAYTGALYHDIGKMLRPEYFVENQRPGHNRHDKLAPSMSALIVINHVKEGVEMAQQHGLPQPIHDAIEQHHGTRLLTYFYDRAKKQSPQDCDEVLETKYRYPGPKPKNKVMGVLMLADAVEAASRTLINPTPVKIRTLLRTLFQDCLKDGQLDETDLTLGDVTRVSDAFFRVLTTVVHRRIDYPGFDFNAEAKKRRFGVVEGAKVS